MSLVEHKNMDDIKNATIDELKIHRKNIHNMCKEIVCIDCIYRINKFNICIFIVKELERKERRM